MEVLGGITSHFSVSMVMEVCEEFKLVVGHY